jgi:hypothetical protein
MREFIWLSWLNYLGGFEYWLFTGYKDHNISIGETGETKRNLFVGWPKSYGATADTVTKQTFRRTKKQKVIRTQFISRSRAEAMGEMIKSAVVVQIITDRRTRRTIIVDTDSITVQKESDKVHSLSFVATYTDDYPNQHT